MEKIKFDFEATKERIYAPNSNVPIGAPVDRNGNIANDGNAYGIVLCKETENEKYWLKYNLVVMVAGYCDIIDAQEIWGGEYSAEAIAAMSDIVFCDNHMIPGGSDPVLDNAKATGGIGWTEQGEQVLVDGENVLTEFVSDGLSQGVFAEHFDIVDGVYSVLFDGAEYELNSVEAEVGGTEIYIIGRISDDLYHPYDFSTFPFVIVDTPDGVRLFTPTAGAHAVTVKEVADTIHKINEKYLPASGGGGVFEIFYNSGTTTVDKTFSDIKQAYYAGKNVTLRIDGDVILQVSMMPMSDDDSDIVFSGLADIDIDTQATELQSANVYQVTISSDESVQYEQGYFGF